LIGRKREQQSVLSLLKRADVGLVTTTGAGGTGKTRLSMQVTADLVDDFRDGVFFVQLAALSDPSMVDSTIATALGV
jgi:predicted ATPase